jgi:hypothetical protein
MITGTDFTDNYTGTYSDPDYRITGGDPDYRIRGDTCQVICGRCLPHNPTYRHIYTITFLLLTARFYASLGM